MSCLRIMVTDVKFGEQPVQYQIHVLILINYVLIDVNLTQKSAHLTCQAQVESF